MSDKKKGTKQSAETIAKRTEILKGRKHSEESKKKMSEIKLGDKNPRYGARYTEEEKKIKVDKLLSVPRWNKGKTKDNDPLIAKLAEKLKGRIPANSIRCKLLNTISNEEWEGNSLKDLAKKCPLSIASINRLKKGEVGSKSILLNYKLEVNNDS